MSYKDAVKVTHCRICNSSDLFSILSLGSMPIPNGFLRKEDIKSKEKIYPLEICGCERCGLVQVGYIVDPSVMFSNYLYIPSASQTRIENFQKIARETTDLIPFHQNDLVIDIGSNDGSLLTCFKNIGASVVGVDPAENLVTVARLHGIPTINSFFDSDTAKKIIKENKHAKVVTATNVFAHVGDLHALMRAITTVLTPDGIFMAQFPYLLDLIKENQFDTIYHEHLSYLSLRPLVELTAQTDLEIFDVKHDPLDGGSLKVFWKMKKNTQLSIHQKNLDQFQILEEKEGLYLRKTYRAFASRVKKLRTKTRKKLVALKKNKKTIVGYGAAAKGNILLHYFGLDSEIISYVVDSTPYKQGLYTPGTHIPIYAESNINENIPDFIFILAWNFKEEIIKKNSTYQKHGGKFIVAIPELQIIN